MIDSEVGGGYYIFYVVIKSMFQMKTDDAYRCVPVFKFKAALILQYRYSFIFNAYTE
jgi:hypothetical protein